jgi:hypothetical protein
MGLATVALAGLILRARARVNESIVLCGSRSPATTEARQTLNDLQEQGRELMS